MPPHGGGGHSCEGDHDHHESPETGILYSLYQKIDKDNLECLNESVEGAGKTVFKPWENRLQFDQFVESNENDEELLFNIPFTGNVKLKGFVVIGGEGDFHPSRVRLFKNRPHMTFDDVEVEADQEFEMHSDENGTLEYPTRIVKFSSVSHLTMHFPSNFGESTTKIYYIGLKGEYSIPHRHGVTICSYETRPNISDHKSSLEDQVVHQIQ